MYQSSDPWPGWWSFHRNSTLAILKRTQSKKQTHKNNHYIFTLPVSKVNSVAQNGQRSRKTQVLLHFINNFLMITRWILRDEIDGAILAPQVLPGSIDPDVRGLDHSAGDRKIHVFGEDCLVEDSIWGIGQVVAAPWSTI